MDRTDDLVHWPVLRFADDEFLHNVEKFYVFNEGLSALLLTKDLKVFAIGDNTNGCLGLGHTEYMYCPVELEVFRGDKIAQITGGHQHILLLLTTGSLFSWGFNRFGQAGCQQKIHNNNNNKGDQKEDNEEPEKEEYAKPMLILTNIKMVSSHPFYSVALTHNGAVWCWGYSGQIGLNHPNPTRIEVMKKKNVTFVECACASILMLTHKGSLYYLKNLTSAKKLILQGSLRSIHSITASGPRGFIVLSEGSIYHCYMGRNEKIKPEKIDVQEKVASIWYVKTWNGPHYLHLSPINRIAILNSRRILTLTSLMSLPDACALYSPIAITPTLTSLPLHSVRQPVLSLINKFHNPKTSNITIVVKGKQIYLNRSACQRFSPYLSKLFCELNKPEQQIEVDGYSFPVFFAFLRFLLTATAEVEPDWTLELLSLAIDSTCVPLQSLCLRQIKLHFSLDRLRQLYQSRKSRRHVTRYFEATMSADSCCYLYQWACEINDRTMCRKVVQWLAANDPTLKALHSSEHFRCLPTEMYEQIVREMCIGILKDTELF